jgi:hypothetical protein
MNILLYCPDPQEARKICEYIRQLESSQVLIALTESLVVDLALTNDIKLLLLFDPTSVGSMLDLQSYLRKKRRRMRVRILPSDSGHLMTGWQQVISDALVPSRPRERSSRPHPRFQWKPRD